VQVILALITVLPHNNTAAYNINNSARDI